MNSQNQFRSWIAVILILLASVGVSLASESFVDSVKNDFTVDTHSVLKSKYQADYSKEGADTCLDCHDEDSKTPVLDIFKTAHGSQGVSQGPFANNSLQCESCHGPAGKHSKKRLRKGEQREAMIGFVRNEPVPVLEKNEICLSCHQRNDLNHWQGSIHQTNDTACSDCHQIHTQRDPMSENAAQVQQCGQCHATQKLAINRASTHPLRYGQMGCTDCHNSHDSDGEKLLVAETINETCYQCHMEKRGPFLWEHEPVSDNCVNCHLSHGSNQPAMLTQRAPYLCINCHSSEGHVSVNALPSGQQTALLLGRSCANCHSQVHGSNHPSGRTLQR